MNYLDLSPDRTTQHNDDSSQRVLSEDHDKVGLSGEFAFGEFSGVWPDTSLRRGGDNGVDFTISLSFTVDVKTYRKPANLIHERGKPFADIFVLAGFNEDTGESQLVGWEWGAVLKGSPCRDFGYGIINHYIAASDLRPMSALARRIAKPSSNREGGGGT